MAIEVGSAYVSIWPNFRQFGSGIQSEVAKAAKLITGGIGEAGDEAGREAGQRIASGVRKGTDGISFGGLIRQAAGFAAVLGVGGIAGAAAKMGISTAASLEQAQIGFTTLLGSGEQAKGFLSDLQKFAAATPFELPGLIDSSRTLLGVGLAADQVIPTLTAFGDAAGAVGVGQEAFQRIMLATSQAVSAGRFATEDLNQITENGIPVWRILSEAMGKPVPVLRDMASKGQLLASDVLPVLQQQMEQDYGGAMARQSQTLAGVWSTLMDSINIGLAGSLKPLVPMLTAAIPKAADLAGAAFGAIGHGISDFVGGLVSGKAEGSGFGGMLSEVGADVRGVFDFMRGTAIPALIDFGGWIRDNTDWLVPLAAGIGGMVATFYLWHKAMLAAQAVQKAWVVGTKLWAIATGAQTVAQTGLTASIWTTTAALLANPITWVVAGLIGLGIALYEAYRHSQTFRDIVNGAFHAVADAGLWLWNVVLKPTWDALVAAFNFVVGAVQAAWTGFLAPTFAAIGAAGLWLWDAVLKPTWDALVAAWNFVVGAVAAVWDSVGAPLFRAVGAIVSWLWDTVLKVAFFAIKAEWTILVGVLRWAWDNIGSPVFHAIAAIAGWLWDTVLKVVFFAIKAEWSILVGVLRWAWDNIGSPVFHAIATVVGWLWTTVLAPVFGAIKSAWGLLLDGMKWAWEHVLKPVWDAIVVAAHVVGDTLGKAFDGLKDAFSAAFRFAKDAVVGGWNAIAGWVNDHVIDPINAVFHIGIKPVPTFGGGGGGAGKGGGAKLMAAGGPVIGPGTSTSDSIPAMLSHGEFVMNAAAVQRIGVGTLNLLNRRGRLVNLGPGGDAGGARFGLPGFAAGGSVDIDAIRAWIHQQVGKPYVMGATGPDAWDCSGLVGAVWALATGKDPFRRYFSTVNEGDGFFQPGMGGPNDFNVGYEGGAGGAGHTVGTFAGLNFEATPPHALVGATNYTPTSGLFTGHGHLPLGQKTLWGWLYEHTVGEVKDALHAAMAGVAGHVPALGVMSDVLRSIVTSAVDLLPFDDGGLLMPGQAGFNGTRRPEPVFTGGQWDVLEGVAAGGGRGDTHINVYPQRADFGVRDLEALQARQDALSRVRRPR